MSAVASVRSIPGNRSNGVSFEEHQQYLSADREHAKCFFAWNGLEEETGEGTVNDTYYTQTVEEGDQD